MYAHWCTHSTPESILSRLTALCKWFNYYYYYSKLLNEQLHHMTWQQNTNKRAWLVKLQRQSWDEIDSSSYILELSCSLSSTDTFESSRQPPTAESLQDPPESSNGTTSTPTGSSDRGHTAHTTNVPLASDVNEASGNRTGGDHTYEAAPRWVRMSTAQMSTMQKSTMQNEGTVQDRIIDMCGLYSLNPFCIEWKYFQPETNRSWC